MATPDKVWWGVTYEPTGKRMPIGGVKLGTDLLIHLLGGGDPESKDTLCKRFAAARTLDERTETVAYNWDGKRVKPEDVQLPPIL